MDARVVTLWVIFLFAACGGQTVSSRAEPEQPDASATDGAGQPDGASGGCQANETTCNGACCSGTCSDGRCLVTLASVSGTPDLIALDATSVYWTNLGDTAQDGSVLRVSKTGGPVIQLASTPTPAGIAVDGTSVYWTSSAAGTVKRVPIAGGLPTPLASQQLEPGQIAVDATNVYWANWGDPGAIMKAPIVGGPTTVLAPASLPFGIAVDDESVYWSQCGGDLKKIPIGGGLPVSLASVGCSHIALNATSVCALSSGAPGENSVLWKVPLGGGTQQKLASGSYWHWTTVAVDLTHAYWTDAVNGGLVSRAPLAGGESLILASKQPAPRAIAVDDTSVYWTDLTGKVMKLTPK